MAYKLEGSLLEVCTCRVLCPCWIGEDPDFGICDGTLAWKIEKGTIDGVDVSGLSICLLAHIPGNILQGNWRAVVFVDERATKEQGKALLDVYTGNLGCRGGRSARCHIERVAGRDAQQSLRCAE